MTHGIDLAHRDQNVRIQDDLFRHVNGRWLAEAEIPNDRATDGAFHRLRDQAERDVRSLLDGLLDASGEIGSEAQQVGDLYRSFLDEAAADRKGLDPLADDLAAIEATPDLEAFAGLLGRLARGGLPGVFGVSVFADARSSDRYAVYVSQAGLGLPDEAFYREDAFADIRSAYSDHLEAMFELAGADAAAARESAGMVMDLETRLAAHHWDQVRDRDAEQTYNPYGRADLESLTPTFNWGAWLTGLGASDAAFSRVIVREPSFLEGLDELLREVPLAQWKAWLRWHVLHDAAPYLGSEFVTENFRFYGATLTGAPELRERWKRGVALVEALLGEAVGKLYVAEHFPPAAKAQMLSLVGNLIEAYRARIEALDWMTAETRKRALEKLDAFTAKIGYPDVWRSYEGLSVVGDDLVGNVRRAASFETDRALGRIGQPVDRDEWFMTPQTVNAYYNPLMNEIVFPAAILRPPFFDPEADPAVNYGAIGAVIGHEIGHGFDDQGSRYDGAGNLSDWWTEDDRTAFEERTKKLIAQYDALEPAQTPGHAVNGAFTVGENIGDLGGLSIALVAYGLAGAADDDAEAEPLTGVQRFFWSWAQAWRTKSRDAEVVRLLAVDPHSPPEFRCNAVVRNIDAFHEAFGVGEGDRMWLDPSERVRIW